MSTAAEIPSDGAELRQRQARGQSLHAVAGIHSEHAASEGNLPLEQEQEQESSKSKKTFGRTPDGTGASAARAMACIAHMHVLLIRPSIYSLCRAHYP